MTAIGLQISIPDELPFSALTEDAPRRLLFATDTVLVAFCALSAVVAGIAWARGDAGAAPLIAIATLLVVNIALSRHPLRWQHPMRIELVRAAFGAVLAPVTYLVTDKPFGHWWAGFLLMALTGSVTVGILTGSPRASRILVSYYIALFAGSVAIAGNVGVARAIVVGGGITIAVVLAGEVIAVLGQKLAVERGQREHIERLMLRVFPQVVATALEEDRVVADEFESASILFADLESFTHMADQMPASEVVALLNDVFTEFDRIVDEHGLEKIKTIGDCYMVAAGVPEPRADHAVALCEFALRLQTVVADRTFRGHQLRFRIGINSGPIFAGVIGQKRFLYDLWGDAVNVASRMESTGVPGAVQITDATRALVGNAFTCEERGLVDVKGKGLMRAWTLVGRTARV
jgi:class 3 adenylate cyclase